LTPVYYKKSNVNFFLVLNSGYNLLTAYDASCVWSATFDLRLQIRDS